MIFIIIRIPKAAVTVTKAYVTLPLSIIRVVVIIIVVSTLTRRTTATVIYDYISFSAAYSTLSVTVIADLTMTIA